MSNPTSTGSTFARVKTWIKEKLTYQDLNAEFDNILNNLDPLGVGSMSASIADMRLSTDPYPSQVENLATDLNGEIQRLRAMIVKISGGTYWYSDPTTLYTTKAQDLLVYVPFTGETTANAFANTIKHGVIINSLSLTTACFATTNLSTNAKFGTYGWTNGAGTIIGFANPAPVKAALSFHIRNFSAGDYLAYNPLMKIWMYIDGSNHVNFKGFKATAASSETAKDSITPITGSITAADSTGNYHHIALNYSLNSYDGAGADSVSLYVDGTSEGVSLTSQTIAMNQGAGGIWFIGAKPDALTLGTQAWDHFSSMKATPNANSDAWTGTNTGQGAVSGGILTITTAAADTTYSLASNVDLSGMTMETKFKISSSTLGTELAKIINALDDSMDRGFSVQADIANLYFMGKSTSGALLFQMPLDCTQYNQVRVTSLGATNPVVKMYVNGMLVFTYTNSTADATATDHCLFGTFTGGTGNMVMSFEYFAYIGSVGGTVYPPIAVNAGTGQVDDISLINGNINSTVVGNLRTTAASTVYGADPAPGPYLPAAMLLGTDDAAVAGVNRHTDGTGDEVASTKLYFASDGVTPLNFQSSAQCVDSNAAAISRLQLLYDGLRPLVSSGINAGGVISGTTVTLCTTVILPAGLHRVAFKFYDLTTVDSLDLFHAIICISRGNP